MKKNYITKAYIDMLTNKEKETGVYYTTPKVVVKGDKYRKALNPTEKLIYQELWDLTKKAAHKGQIDEKGRVYVKASYSSLATAIGMDVSTVDRTLSKRKGLFHTGLLAIKKHGNSSTTEYYVMAPVYEGADEMYLANDGITVEAQLTVKSFQARKGTNKNTKREAKNEQLEEQRKSDTVKDTAHYEVIKREEVNNMPDGIEVKQEKQTEQLPEPQEKSVTDKKYVEERSSQSGFYGIFLIEKKSNGIVEETNLLRKFPKATSEEILNFARKNYEVKQVELSLYQ